MFQIKAPKFGGTPKEDLETFLSQLKLRFEDTKIVEDERKVALTIQCLRGEAGRWVADKVNQLDSKKAEKVVPNLWATYDKFIEYLREQSGEYYDLGETAGTRLHTIVQGRSSIREYNREFLKLQNQLKDKNFGPDSYLYNYKRGLRRKIYENLLQTPGSIEWTLKDWMENTNNLGRGALHAKEIGQEYTPKHDKGQRFEPHFEPMDIDRRVVSKNRKGTKCFRCGKIGHFARDCKVKVSGTRSGVRRPKRAQLQVIPEGEEEEGSEDLQEEDYEMVDATQDFQEAA